MLKKPCKKRCKTHTKTLRAKKCPQCFSNGNSLLILPALLLNILFYCSVDFCNIKISSAGGDVTAFYNSKTVNIICIGCSAAESIRCFYFSDIRCGRAGFIVDIYNRNGAGILKLFYSFKECIKEAFFIFVQFIIRSRCFDKDRA